MQNFSESNTKLMELSPKLEIRQISHDDEGECDYKEIHLIYPFIFDLRLIPESFNDISVISGCDPNSLPLSFQSEEEVFLGDLFSPENYEKFVDENIDEIRIKLKRKDISKSEALDALTGNFENHIVFINNFRTEHGR